MYSANHLKHIALAMHNYHVVHGCFPPATVRSADGQPLYSWRVLLLPYLDEEKLYREFHLDESWDSPHNRKLLSHIPPVYDAAQVRAEPGDPPHSTFYQVFVGEETPFGNDECWAWTDLTDAALTCLVVEAGRPGLLSPPQ